MVRCKAREDMGDVKYVYQGAEVGIHWDRYMGGSDDMFNGLLRWDANEPVDTRWKESANDKITFLSTSERDFVRKMYGHSTLRVRLWDYKGRTHDVEFNVQGLRQHIEENPQLCSGLMP